MTRAHLTEVYGTVADVHGRILLGVTFLMPHGHLRPGYDHLPERKIFSRWRAPAQGACAYANICEHCPNFHTDSGYLPVLAPTTPPRTLDLVAAHDNNRTS